MTLPDHRAAVPMTQRPPCRGPDDPPDHCDVVPMTHPDHCAVNLMTHPDRRCSWAFLLGGS
eukprot:6657451-Alexandrium_andersonii.AAC.1